MNKWRKKVSLLDKRILKIKKKKKFTVQILLGQIKFSLESHPPELVVSLV